MRRIALACFVVLSAMASVAVGSTLTSRLHTLRPTWLQAHRWKAGNGRDRSRHPHRDGSAASTIPGADPVLFGDQTTESRMEGVTAGLADAFPFSNQTNATTASIAVYLDSSNRASKLIAGLYSDNNGKPGSLIASGSLSSPS